MDTSSVPEATKQLLADLGFSEASPDEQQKVINQIQEMVDTEILYALTSRLSDAQIAELDELTKSNEGDDNEKMRQMVDKIKTMLPDYEEIVARSIDDLYTRLKDDVKSVSDFMNNPKYRKDITGLNETETNNSPEPTQVDSTTDDLNRNDQADN